MMRSFRTGLLGMGFEVAQTHPKLWGQREEDTLGAREEDALGAREEDTLGAREEDTLDSDGAP